MPNPFALNREFTHKTAPEQRRCQRPTHTLKLQFLAFFGKSYNFRHNHVPPRVILVVMAARFKA
jgi:hypothetical protein